MSHFSRGSPDAGRQAAQAAGVVQTSNSTYRHEDSSSFRFPVGPRLPAACVRLRGEHPGAQTRELTRRGRASNFSSEHEGRPKPQGEDRTLPPAAATVQSVTTCVGVGRYPLLLHTSRRGVALIVRPLRMGCCSSTHRYARFVASGLRCVCATCQRLCAVR